MSSRHSGTEEGRAAGKQIEIPGVCDAQGSQDLGDQLGESEVAAWCGGHLNQESGRRNVKKEPASGSWHWVPEACVETGMARSWPPGGFSGWGWVCVLAVHALLPVSKLACFSLWLGFPSHSDPGWGQTQPPVARPQS